MKLSIFKRAIPWILIACVLSSLRGCLASSRALSGSNVSDGRMVYSLLAPSKAIQEFTGLQTLQARCIEMLTGGLNANRMMGNTMDQYGRIMGAAMGAALSRSASARAASRRGRQSKTTYDQWTYYIRPPGGGRPFKRSVTSRSSSSSGSRSSPSRSSKRSVSRRSFPKKKGRSSGRKKRGRGSPMGKRTKSPKKGTPKKDKDDDDDDDDTPSSSPSSPARPQNLLLQPQVLRQQIPPQPQFRQQPPPSPQRALQQLPAQPNGLHQNNPLDELTRKLEEYSRRPTPPVQPVNSPSPPRRPLSFIPGVPRSPASARPNSPIGGRPDPNQAREPNRMILDYTNPNEMRKVETFGEPLTPSRLGLDNFPTELLRLPSDEFERRAQNSKGQPKNINGVPEDVVMAFERLPPQKRTPQVRRNGLDTPSFLNSVAGHQRFR